jgi:hypothetical protein
MNSTTVARSARTLYQRSSRLPRTFVRRETTESKPEPPKHSESAPNKSMFSTTNMIFAAAATAGVIYTFGLLPFPPKSEKGVPFDTPGSKGQ